MASGEIEDEPYTQEDGNDLEREDTRKLKYSPARRTRAAACTPYPTLHLHLSSNYRTHTLRITYAGPAAFANSPERGQALASPLLL
ncbi:hypothetical protein Taro_019666 [Colocasia esculenta]|uniref:Uncharacterized protein n=1 Tax=Colocasia esculenta TaxID=4460 RepID=A0A843UXF1_COLES|nr:hypothetical protein [Colocasia esculenta]